MNRPVDAVLQRRRSSKPELFELFNWSRKMSERIAQHSPLMTKRDVAAYLQCSLRQINLMVKAGKIPAPFYISSGAPRWHFEDLQRHLNSLRADAIGDAE
jgi:predicted DNA-binding transcriptional regulator AlpA